jgi:glycosyl transferase family 2
VIIAKPQANQAVQDLVEHLRRQSVKKRLELLFVTGPTDEFVVDQAIVSEFAAIRSVPIGECESVAQARAAGIFAAHAPIVVLAENHSLPSPDWAEAMIRAHQDPWAAVGPAVNNGNSSSLISWALHFITYGRWSDPVQAGVTEDLPGHNSSYKREILIRYDSELAALLEAETMLHADLVRNGNQLFLEPKAKTVHFSPIQFSVGIEELYHYGRMFAAARVRKLNYIRRFFFGFASILIPWVRLRRISRDVRRSARRDLLPRLIPVMIVMLMASAAGEMMGYWFGAGDSVRKMNEFEMDLGIRR